MIICDIYATFCVKKVAQNNIYKNFISNSAREVQQLGVGIHNLPIICDEICVGIGECK